MAIPASSLPQFDELYSVSDLHLGGPPGFQIFDTGAAFARVADDIAARAAANRRVALLVNGDLVDFLAERPFLHFDPIGALDKLDRLVADPGFQPVWHALQRFAATPNCHLAINLGNHDLELALPWVRSRLLEILSGGSEPVRGRLTLVFDGAGFRCRVGGADVLAVHGNEVDTWNVADYEAIRRIGRDLTQGIPVDPWIPNAGSRLVIEVMNDIKARFPFVDLLKPELGAVVPTILALAPDQRDKVKAIRGTVGRLLIDRVRRGFGLLGGEAIEDIDAMEATGMMTTGVVTTGVVTTGVRRVRPRSAVPPSGAEYASALLDEAEERLAREREPLSLIAADTREDYLGGRMALANFLRGASASEVLREALEGLAKDRSFDLATEDEQFRLLDEQMGDVDFLLAGHTHLERAIRRRRGRGVYFNSGTWVRLIQFHTKMLSDKGAFDQVYRSFQAGTMQALDDHPGLVLRRPTVVAIWNDAGRVHAELRRAGVGAADPVMSQVAGSRFDA